MEPQVLAARGLYLNGSLDASLRKAQEILRLVPEDFSMHLLICRCVCVHLACAIMFRSLRVEKYGPVLFFLQSSFVLPPTLPTKSTK